MKRILFVIAITAIVGGAISGYALWQHYAPVGSSFCNVSATISCDIVNKSAFSEIVGIPVALIGVLGYVLLFAFSVLAIVSPAHRHWWMLWMFAGVATGVVFQFVLSAIEFSVIGVVCPLCVGSQITIGVLFVLASMAWMMGRGDTVAPSIPLRIDTRFPS